MIELYENLSRKEAELCTLVLKSSSIPYRKKRGDGGWGIWVDERHYAAARQTMRRYFEENREEEPAGVAETAPEPHGFAGLWMAAVIAAAHAIVHAGPGAGAWEDFGASAARINSGELYRSVTALMLHADPVHLVGNMAGFALFGTAVCQTAGWGVGSLMILLTGIFGNLVNAWMYQSAHLSIGASTAVFGAIGILSGYPVADRKKTGKRPAPVWLSLAAGLALLGLLGSGGEDGGRVDLAAHLFGFLAGIAAGAAYGFFRRPRGKGAQWTCLIIAAGTVSGAWAWGYLISG